MGRVGAFAAAIAAAFFLASCTQSQAKPARAYAPQIARDSYGVPTINGATDADVAYGLALAHAEDDFATIQEVILASRGRLGAHKGRDGAQSDYLWHVLRVEETIAATYERDLQPRTRAILEAYAAGLNAYSAAHPRERIAGADALTGRDIAAGFVLTSPLFCGLDRLLGKLVDGKESVCATRPQPVTVPERGSNAFAVAPSRSADGHTRLILNSHQPWSGPVAWYEVRVRSGEGWHFDGALFPGSPTPLFGHNPDLGWATTVNQTDLVDLYRLHTDREHPDQYLFDGAWRKFDMRTIWLHVKIGPIVVPVPRTLRESVHGPAFETPDGWVAVRYAGAGDGRTVEQYVRMTQARTFDAWRAALAMRAIPSSNYVYADRTGKIGLFYNASLPRRAEGLDWSGCVPGDTSATLWRQGDWVDPPALIAPTSGWLYSANGTPFSATDPSADLSAQNFSRTLGIEMTMTNRGHRAVELLAPLSTISEEQLLTAKFDVTYSPRSAMRAAVAAVLADASPDLAPARALLGAWDFRATKESRAAALALLMYAPIRRAERLGMPAPDPVSTAKEAMQSLLRGFGRIDPPLGDALRLRRGNVDLPLDGGPDLLRAIGWTLDPDGRMRADFGDGFMMLVDWAPDGTVNTRSIHQFGAATSRPQSAHYADQAGLFAQHAFRPRGQ